MQQITLEQIKETILNSEQTEWNISNALKCPAAQTGKRLFNESFEMLGHIFGVYYTKQGECIKVEVPEAWARYTMEWLDHSEGESVILASEEILRAIEKMQLQNID